MGSQETIFRKGRSFPIEDLCGHCQDLLSESATEGHCQAIDLRIKNRRRASRLPRMKPVIEQMTISYEKGIAEKRWGCKLTDVR
jgi:hypothetical protein